MAGAPSYLQNAQKDSVTIMCAPHIICPAEGGARDLAAALEYYRGLFDARRAGRLPINEMHTPTLTIYGGNDPTARYSVKEEPYFKGSHQRVVLPDVGHFPHLEREAELTDLIMGWFKTHAPD